jgi:glycosyltransferase involved in cell wall biosynthesis
MGMGGTQRAAKFAKYLPHFGWSPTVITVKDIVYYAHDDSLIKEIGDIPIYRTESLDPLRLLARFSKNKKQSTQQIEKKNSKNFLNILNEVIGGFLFIPDSKILWLPFAIISSLKIIRNKKAKVVFTTSPPHSAHLGGLILKIITSVKWVADFRDEWTGGESQPCPSVLHLWINRILEKLILKRADHIIGMCDHLTNSLKQKTGTTHNKFTTIMNGYDSDDFQNILDTPLNDKFTITHCGSISRVSNPEPFLAAVRMLIDEFKEIEQKLKIQFIGTDIYGHLQQLLHKYNLTPFIKPIEYLPHHEALKRAMASHLLLITIFKKTKEEIISGKIFEYLGSGKKILLISTGGEVANIIRSLNRGTIVNNSDISNIKNAIYDYFRLFQGGRFNIHKPISLKEFDRKYLTGQLAHIFENLLKL